MDKSLDLEEQYDRIYRYCYFKTHSRETAEDITQETFLRFFQSRPELSGGDALRFLYTVARNLCVDEYRRRQFQPLDEKILSADEENGILTNITVRDALSRLEPGHRELLLLRYVNEVPIAVIGDLHGISRFSVRRRIAKAVKEFRQYLGEEDPL